jgi:multidrug efflux system membrane fusion protein
VKLKAEFPNDDLSLWPGQFVNVQLLVDTLKNVVVVPSAAVQRGPNGLFVYVAKDDNTVTLRTVQISQQDELQTVVTSGLQAGERVATTGFNQLADGSKIQIGTGDGTPPPVAPRSANPRRRGAAAGATDAPGQHNSAAAPQGAQPQNTEETPQRGQRQRGNQSQ